jgi:hypothetical protein
MRNPSDHGAEDSTTFASSGSTNPADQPYVVWYYTYREKYLLRLNIYLRLEYLKVFYSI